MAYNYYNNFCYPAFNYGFPQFNGFSFPNFQAAPQFTATPTQAQTNTASQAAEPETTKAVQPTVETTPQTKTEKVVVDLSWDDFFARKESDKNVSFYETTPEKAEEFRKKWKNDDTTRGIIAIASVVGLGALACWLGPKGAKYIKDGGKWLGNIKEFLSDPTCSCLAGVLAGFIPCAAILTDKSTKKNLIKEYFPESQAKTN